MAINQLQIPSSGNINNLVDQSQWQSLSNLGNVYQKAQQDAANKQAFAAFQQTGDPKALIGSGDMNLARLGVEAQSHMDALKQQEIQNRRAEEELGFQRATANRAQTDWLQKDKDAAEAARLIRGLGGGGAPAAPAGPTPFPAPMPGAVPSPTPGPTAAVAPAPGQQSPPVMAADESSLPAWATPQSQVAQNIPPSQVQPAAPAGAAGGITRDQLAALYKNPETRAMATTFLQNQMTPGTWSHHFDDNTGRVIATNNKTNEVKDVTPGGIAATSKQQQEVQGYFKAGKDLGMTDDQATAFAANKGKTPKEDLNPTEMKLIEEKTKAIHSGEDVLDNIHRLQELSKTAWSGAGASTAARVAGAVLPGGMIPQGATDTTELENVAIQNVARQAKETFGSRLAVAEVKLLNEIETNPLQSNEARQRIYTRLESMFNRHMNDMTTEREQIRNKTFFKPGAGGATPQPAPDAASTPSDNLAAAKWASQNPNDPRAQAIIQHLKGQGQ